MSTGQFIITLSAYLICVYFYQPYIECHLYHWILSFLVSLNVQKYFSVLAFLLHFSPLFWFIVCGRRSLMAVGVGDRLIIFHGQTGSREWSRILLWNLKWVLSSPSFRLTSLKFHNLPNSATNWRFKWPNTLTLSIPFNPAQAVAIS